MQKVWKCPLCTLKGHIYNFLNYDVFLSLKIVLILANSANSDEMQHFAAFHLGLHCWPKYLLGVTSTQRGNALKKQCLIIIIA